MNIFFTSDTHFYHQNIIKFAGRPFYTDFEMNENMIVQWNSVVQDTDTIYHLGDFSFGNGAQNKELGAQFNGHKYLCIGSHDKQVPNGVFEDIKDSYMIHFNNDIGNDQHIFMSHYLHKIWPISHYDSWHLFGHSHGRMNDYASVEGKLLDVGVDSHNFTPWRLDEVIEVMKTRPMNFNSLQKKHEDRHKELTERK